MSEPNDTILVCSACAREGDKLLDEVDPSAPVPDNYRPYPCRRCGDASASRRVRAFVSRSLAKTEALEEGRLRLLSDVLEPGTRLEPSEADAWASKLP